MKVLAWIWLVLTLNHCLLISRLIKILRFTQKTFSNSWNFSELTFKKLFSNPDVLISRYLKRFFRILKFYLMNTLKWLYRLTELASGSEKVIKKLKNWFNVPSTIRNYKKSSHKAGGKTFQCWMTDFSQNNPILTNISLSFQRSLSKSHQKVFRASILRTCADIIGFVSKSSLITLCNQGVLIFVKFCESYSRTALFLGSGFVVYQAATSKTVTYSTNIFHLNWRKESTALL